MGNNIKNLGVTKDDLINKMKGQLTTNNWDVVCCYNETKINELLAQKYKSGKLVTEVPFKGSYHDDFFDADVNIDGTLKLKEPLLNFVLGERYLCNLKMEIEGGSYNVEITGRPKKTEDIPGGVIELVSNVPMAAICGDTKKVEDGGKVIDFDSGSTSQSIFLHFQNTAQTTFDIVPVEGKEADAKNVDLYANPNVRPVIIEIIKEYFKSNVEQIEYAVGGITNKKSDESVVLLPKSFIFSASKPDPNKEGSLNLYIQTVNSGNPQGDLTPNFQPGGTAELPIPDGYTASLILSNNLMNKILIDQFKDIKINPELQTVSEGICIALKKDDKIKIPGVHTMGMDQCNSQDLNIDFNTSPYMFNLTLNNLQLSWSFSQRIKWTEDTVDPTGGYIHDAGEIEVDASADKTFPLTSTSDQNLDFDCSLKESDINVTTKTIKKMWPSWMSGENTFKDDIKSKVPGAIGNVSFNLKSVSVFAVSSLLFPDNNIFNIDCKEGFHVPKDLILFGNIGE